MQGCLWVVRPPPQGPSRPPLLLKKARFLSSDVEMARAGQETLAMRESCDGKTGSSGGVRERKWSEERERKKRKFALFHAVSTKEHIKHWSLSVHIKSWIHSFFNLFASKNHPPPPPPSPHFLLLKQWNEIQPVPLTLMLKTPRHIIKN